MSLSSILFVSTNCQNSTSGLQCLFNFKLTVLERTYYPCTDKTQYTEHGGEKEKGKTKEKRDKLSFCSFPLLIAYWLLIKIEPFGSTKISLDRIDLDRISSDRFGSNRFTDSTYHPMHTQGLGLQITRYYGALGKPVPV